MNASDDLILEHALLVSRGVRYLALVDSTGINPEEMAEAWKRLAYVLGPDYALPFVLPDSGGRYANAGYAADQWAIDLFEWIHREGPPLRFRHMIIGMLLGYSSAAIAKHDAHQFGGRPRLSPQESMTDHCSTGSEETGLPG